VRTTSKWPAPTIHRACGASNEQRRFEPPLVCFELTPERLPDHLDFFDRRAFTDNLRWARCHCPKVMPSGANA
jgi:hypothetical protein